MRLLSFSQSGIMSDEFGTCATAAADDVHDAFIDEFGDFGAIDSAVSSYSPISLGRPALGWALI